MIPAALLAALAKPFGIVARLNARGMMAVEDFEQEMWFHLVRIARNEPALFAFLAAQTPFYIARRCAGRARAVYFKERAEKYGATNGRRVVGREATREIVECDASPATLSPLEAEEEALWTRPLFAHLASLYA